MAQRRLKRPEVLRLVEMLKPILRLQDWAISVQFAKSSKERAACTAAPEYKEAVLYFDVKRIPFAELPGFVLHEMLHIHIWKLAAVGERLAANPKDMEAVTWEEESTVTELEHILLPLVPGMVEPSGVPEH